MKKNKIAIVLNDYGLENSLGQYGINLAKALELPVSLLGIENPPLVTTPSAVVGTGLNYPETLVMKDLEKEANLKLKALSGQYRKSWPFVEYEVQTGFTEVKLSDFEADESPFLILIERKSENSLINKWLGTYETRLAGSVDYPLLLVPEAAQWKGPRNIFYLIQQGDDVMEKVAVLEEIANQFDVNITLAFVSDDELTGNNPIHLKKNRILHHITNRIASVYYEIPTTQVSDRVFDYMKECKADWLCFQYKNQSLWDSLWNGQPIDEVLLKTGKPMLIL